MTDITNIIAIRHVMTDWDEFMEPNSGRKFYYNAKVTPDDISK